MMKKIAGLLPVFAVLAGILILAYPVAGNYLNEKNASRAQGNYEAAVQDMGDEARRTVLEAARAYNAQLFIAEDTGKSLADEYWKMLDPEQNGMMGCISIPRLDETLAIYHGTAEEVLQVGVGHVQNTSLPVGGPSTHAALSGHRGLVSAKLFTDLDQMEIGDVFYIHVLGEILAYQVDRILIVEPDEMDALSVAEGEDYVTLITCTPYGINSHRLLVRGSRIAYDPEEELHVEAQQKPKRLSVQYRYPLIGAAVLVVFFVGMLLFNRISRQKRR